MNIYLVERDYTTNAKFVNKFNNSKDCHSFVCVSKSEETAKTLHPLGLEYQWFTEITLPYNIFRDSGAGGWNTVDGYSDGGVWTSPDNVKVTLLGISIEYIERVITFSYI